MRGMETVVRLDTADGLEEFLARAGWYDVAGIELDLTTMSEADYQKAAGILTGQGIPVKGLHYGRTETVSLQEWDLFQSQLEMVVERAAELGCEVVSVHPPHAEVNETHTMRDLQAFFHEAEAYAAGLDIDLCFELTGVLKDPEMLNTGAAELERDAIGAMVDLGTVVEGIDPVSILEKVDMELRAVAVPRTVAEMVEDGLPELGGDVMVVAAGLD